MLVSRYHFFLLKLIFYWRIVALQCCVGFYCTARWISHTYTYVPSLWDFFPFHQRAWPGVPCARTVYSQSLPMLCMAAIGCMCSGLPVLHASLMLLLRFVHHHWISHIQRVSFLCSPACSSSRLAAFIFWASAVCPRDAATEKTKGHHTQKHKLPPSPFDLKIRNKTSIIFCTAQDFAQLGCFMQMCASVVTGSLEHFTTSKRSPVPFSDLSYFPIPQPSQPLSLLPVCMDLSVLDVPYPWNHTAWASASDFSPLAVVSRFTHTVACVSVPFLPGTESCSIMGVDDFPFIRSPLLMDVWVASTFRL